MPSFWSLQLLAQTGLLATQQQGILDLIMGSGPIVQAVLYILVVFSVVSWGIIFFKYREVRTAKAESEKFIEIFWDSHNLANIHDVSRELERSPVAHVFLARSVSREGVVVPIVPDSGIFLSGLLLCHGFCGVGVFSSVFRDGPSYV